MASLMRTMKRQTLKVEQPFHFNPKNNRKRTRGRVVQVDPKTGRQIVHLR